METLVINTDVAGHTHPLPFRPSPREQQVRALVARVPITVNLRGLSFGHATTVSDVLVPKVRRAPFNENVNPNHLDVIECWKGLSHTQAMELAMWYQFLHECLHNEVREALSEDVIRDLLKSSQPIEEVYFVARMLECLRSKPQRIMDISFVDVIDSMMAMFHDRFPNEFASLASNWSQFSGGLSLFLHKFLGLQDCFYHSAEVPCLEVNLDFQFARWVLTAIGDVVCQPPSIRFLHVPTTRASGETYRITPFMWKAVDSLIKSPGCDDYVEQVDYTVTRSPATFTWDPAKRCFNTVVSHCRDDKPHTMETVVMATVTTSFPNGNVKFEKRSRWSMKLDITPPHQRPTPKQSLHKAALKLQLKPSTVVSETGTLVHFTSADTSRPASPQKRKVSRPEVANAVTAPKRSRCDSMLEIDDELSNEDLSRNDSIESRYFKEMLRVADYERVDNRISFGGSQPSQHGADQPVGMKCGSGVSSPSTSPVISESTPSDDAAITDQGGLHQEDILHNYHEFAERRLFKDAGLVISPVSDGERRAYESIFIGDSDEWSPITDGSSMNTDTIMSDR